MLDLRLLLCELASVIHVNFAIFAWPSELAHIRLLASWAVRGKERLESLAVDYVAAHSADGAESAIITQQASTGITEEDPLIVWDLAAIAGFSLNGKNRGK